MYLYIYLKAYSNFLRSTLLLNASLSPQWFTRSGGRTVKRSYCPPSLANQQFVRSQVDEHSKSVDLLFWKVLLQTFHIGIFIISVLFEIHARLMLNVRALTNPKWTITSPWACFLSVHPSTDNGCSFSPVSVLKQLCLGIFLHIHWSCADISVRNWLSSIIKKCVAAKLITSLYSIRCLGPFNTSNLSAGVPLWQYTLLRGKLLICSLFWTATSINVGRH